MPVNINTTVDLTSVARMHSAVVDFGALVQEIASNVGSDYSALITIPSRVTNLLAQKAAFDSAGLSAARIAEIAEKNLGYASWSDHTADFAAIFTKAAAFRDAVVANVSSLTPSYTNNQLVWVTAPAGVQSAISGHCADILSHYT